MTLKIVEEGLAKVRIDDVFYNLRMKFCRDLDMLLFRNLKQHRHKHEYLDALAASGIRGIRAALEANYQPILNDRDVKAVEVIKQNLKLNNVDADVYNKDASLLMRERRFYHIDLDPFGSPSEFIDSACYSALKYLSITATDTAALCGSATNSGLRKYSAFAKKTEYYPEVGVRILIGKVAREITKYDRAFEVMLCWAKEHYYRIHLKVIKSTSRAGKLYNNVGYLYHCFDCLNRMWLPMNGKTKEICECGSKFTMIGPLWIGELHKQELISKMLDDLSIKSSETEKTIEFLKRIENEIDAPFYYDIHAISQRLKVAPPQINKIISKLEDEGFKASKTRFSSISFKTDARIEDVKNVILKLSTS
ncbi:tRNA (guanine(10)-N(2))-dimethyltransferase [Archaeoglobales archaeon]|nr:MAG: tRNA (guanine(10)-N(2))-dimethyltransferase [Archaeoglobales archaeon]